MNTARWISQKSAATLAYERTSTFARIRRRAFYLNLLALALVFGALVFGAVFVWEAGAS